MPWTRKLRPPIVLRDGQRLRTLADARALILVLTERRQDAQLYDAAQLLIEAAHGRKGAMAEIAAQLSRALEADGLL